MSEQNTEEKILLAAHKVFSKTGFAGARMDDIAKEAGINRALLHYYYRSKDKLFELVFEIHDAGLTIAILFQGILHKHFC